jgi:hypothetical protein
MDFLNTTVSLKQNAPFEQALCRVSGKQIATQRKPCEEQISQGLHFSP